MTKEELREKVELLWKQWQCPENSIVIELFRALIDALPRADVAIGVERKYMRVDIFGPNPEEEYHWNLCEGAQMFIRGVRVWPITESKADDEAHRLVMDRVKAYREYGWNAQALIEVRAIEKRTQEYYEKHKKGGR